MSKHEFQYCSWCFQKTRHELVEQNYLRRNVYQCAACQNYTVQCRACDAMARGKPKASSAKGLVAKQKEAWDNELCAEHDGLVPDFRLLNSKLDDLSTYRKIFKRRRLNLYKAGKIAGGAVGGAVIAGTGAWIAAPQIAAALGTTGILGSASTGTAISTLSGAALESASLAALGGGAASVGGLGMAGGVAFLGATGAALGAGKGAVVSNAYLGDVKDFDVKRVRSGRSPSIIFVNGFLSQKVEDFSEWSAGVADYYGDRTQYGVPWESKSKYSLGALAVEGGSTRWCGRPQ